jgi:5-methyltetrahydrofolate--homocysteine methyltransferase
VSKEILKKLSHSVIEGQKKEVLALTKEALDMGLSPNQVVQEGLIPGVQKVGELFSQGEYYLPEMIIASNAMQGALGILEPLISGKRDLFHSGKFLMATVKGDIHDIGKNIVVMMLKGSGWEVTDLGVDVGQEKVCAAIQAGDYDILGLSTLLTVTMPAAAAIIEAIKKAGLREKVKIMIGGAPVTQEFAEKIGADEYGKDAWEAVTKARRLIENPKG